MRLVVLISAGCMSRSTPRSPGAPETSCKSRRRSGAGLLS